MYTNIPKGVKDPIFALNESFRNDPREDKIDLGVGVFKNELGLTPLMKAVEIAESAYVIKNQKTKVYKGLMGNEDFNQEISKLLIENESVRKTAAVVQATGGSGALRLISDYIYSVNPDCTVWVSDPSYANHTPILKDAGLTVCYYDYLDSDSRIVDMGRVTRTLVNSKKGDVVLLHGCCHNPTGADLNMTQWHEIADFMLMKGLTPFVDIAYQGLGDTLEKDVGGLNILLSVFKEVFITSSSSKNFGLYAERVGAAIVVCRDVERVSNVRRRLTNIALKSYAMPPNHGAAIVETILTDPFLKKLWIDELDVMRSQIKNNRKALHDALKESGYIGNIDFITSHKGMFSSFGWSEQFTDLIREKYGIYIVKGGRINFAAITTKDVTRIARSICYTQNVLNVGIAV
ncbi:aspartate aminotransferase [Moritella sp. PE36]|uniref:amino acid aminotransferase n=1 Tax=Moritella sp. PE36 TaxID=58051 RepID=UPI00015682F2|nr:aromatic amino acid transaminase [Moritella sp. PE36]EDM67229.1 aspartate aminotransferase [Moritella sp. PE36]